MSALTLSGLIFVLTLGGIFLGTLLRRTLPEPHLNEHAETSCGLESARPRNDMRPSIC
jgi:hypothetical protein